MPPVTTTTLLPLADATRDLNTSDYRSDVRPGPLLFSGCGTDTAGSEAGTDVQDIQQEPAAGAGAFDQPDFADTKNFVGQTVTVSAEVNDVLSPRAFTIAGTLQTGANELLILHADDVGGLDEDAAVMVTGTVAQRFDIPGAERFVGGDLDDDLFGDWNGEPYIQAQTVKLLSTAG